MMKKARTILQMLLVALVAILFAGTTAPVSAQQAAAQAWMPKPPKAAAGSKCDADPAYMRKWHMKELQHKRNETMRKGIRTDKNSLKRCISCHAVKDDSGKYLTVKDKRHFCRSCHDYAAVRIACFDCHASRPGSKEGKGADAGHYLKGNPHNNQLAQSQPNMSTPAEKNENTALAALQDYVGGENK